MVMTRPDLRPQAQWIFERQFPQAANLVRGVRNKVRGQRVGTEFEHHVIDHFGKFAIGNRRLGNTGHADEILPPTGNGFDPARFVNK